MQLYFPYMNDQEILWIDVETSQYPLAAYEWCEYNDLKAENGLIIFCTQFVW